MFGWRLIRDSELELLKRMHAQEVVLLGEQLRKAEEYARKCEALIDHERARIDAERERADRTIDGYLQTSGLPAVTATVLTEQKEQAKDAAGKQKDYLAQLAEIYGETMQEMNLEEQPEPSELN